MGLFRFSHEPQGLGLCAACGCNKGLRRANNEDNFYFDGEYLESDNDGLANILTFDGTDAGGRLFAVFDGMGGGQYGEIASYTAASMAGGMQERLSAADEYDMEDVMTGSCQEMNDAICREIDERSVSHMGTTLAGYYFRDGKAWACNVGDSKCLRFRDGALEQLSVDHTDEETMKMNGVTGRKPFITQYLGIRSEDMSICPSFMKDEVWDGDMYLICSDGLTDMLPPDEIAEILCEEGDEEEKVQALLVGALKNGGRDNITVILCRVYE